MASPNLDHIVQGLRGRQFLFRNCFAFTHYAQLRDAGESHSVICVVNDWDGELAERLEQAYIELTKERQQ